MMTSIHTGEYEVAYFDGGSDFITDTFTFVVPDTGGLIISDDRNTTFIQGSPEEIFDFVKVVALELARHKEASV